MENRILLNYLLYAMLFASLIICPWLIMYTGKFDKQKTTQRRRSLSIIIYYKGNFSSLKRQLSLFLSYFNAYVQLIVVSQELTDKLEQLCLGYNVRFIYISENPANCCDEYYAFYKGAKKADNELLLFTYSDINFTKKAFGKLFRAAQKRKIISVIPYIKADSSRFFHKAAYLFSVMASGAFCIRQQKNPALFRYCLMIDRHDYFNICTHEMIPHCKNEDSLLASAYERASLKVYCLTGGQDIFSTSLDFNSFPSVKLSFNALLSLLYLISGTLIFIFLFVSVLNKEPSFAFAWFYVLYAFVYYYFARIFVRISVLETFLFPFGVVNGLFYALYKLFIVKSELKPSEKNKREEKKVQLIKKNAALKKN